jgi:dienelactone hydrolase
VDELLYKNSTGVLAPGQNCRFAKVTNSLDISSFFDRGGASLRKLVDLNLVGAATLFLVTTIAPVSYSAAEELVKFDSATLRVGLLQQRLAHERGETVKGAPGILIEGYLSKPEGAGPFPAIILLRGCGGMDAGGRLGAERITDWGYVALIVDSFATRGIKDSCTPPAPDRKADAIGALLYLSKLPFVDPERIAIVGYSQGGSVALEIASTNPAGLFEMPDELKFKVAVAFYPWCSNAADQVTIPALVLIGELDDWASAKECERLMERRAGRGAPMKLVVYPGAYEDFDDPSVGNGELFLGHFLKYEPGAAQQSTAEMRDFLEKQLSR